MCQDHEPKLKKQKNIDRLIKPENENENGLD